MADTLRFFIVGSFTSDGSGQPFLDVTSGTTPRNARERYGQTPGDARVWSVMEIHPGPLGP
jgi:hypothetical protein